jgi:hypothetical protein
MLAFIGAPALGLPVRPADDSNTLAPPTGWLAAALAEGGLRLVEGLLRGTVMAAVDGDLTGGLPGTLVSLQLLTGPAPALSRLLAQSLLYGPAEQVEPGGSCGGLGQRTASNCAPEAPCATRLPLAVLHASDLGSRR